MMMSQPPPPVAAASKGKRRKSLIILGVIVLLGGLVGGGAVVAKGMSNYKDAVHSLARAPVGCTTTLVFDKPATFILYTETKGKLGDLGGDCEANGATYEHSGAKLPKVSLSLEGPDGKSVDMARGVRASYDVDNYVGIGVRTMQIEQAGTYHLSVESDESDFAMAIGKNPKDDSEKLTTIGGALALGGIVVGLMLFLLGLRRRKLDPAMADIRYPGAATPGWPPAPYAATPATSPPPYPGFGPAPPIGVPGQPPIRPPEHPMGGFAPPTFAPPFPPAPAVVPTAPPPSDGPPSAVPPVGLPTLPPIGGHPPIQAPPVAPPPPPPSDSEWSFPKERDDESGDDPFGS